MRALLRLVVVAVAAVAGTAGVMQAAPSATPACRLGPALFANPYPHWNGPDHRVTTMQTYQHGTWVGFMYDGISRMDLFTWRRGHKPVVIGHRVYRGVPYTLNWSLVPIGVTPGGAVVANVEDRHREQRHPFAYVRGREIRMHTLRRWNYIEVVSVTDAGHILGYGEVGTGDHRRTELAIWRGIHSRPRVLRTVHPNSLGPYADRRGDFEWSADKYQASTVRVRLASGAVHSLDSGVSRGEDYAALSSSHYLFGKAGRHVVRWDTLRRSTDGGLAPARVVVPFTYESVTAVGPNGDFVYGGDHRHYAWGAGHRIRLPGEYYANGPNGEAIGPHHQVAFTRARDHLVHILHC